jgi:iron complex outermembrane receptor protein
LRYAHYGHQQDEAYPIGTGLPPPYASAFNVFDADTSKDSVEFQRADTYSDRLKAMWGLSWAHDSVTSSHFFFGKGTLGGDSWQAFGNLDWSLGNAWLLHLGGMFEQHYNTNLLFSPRVALNYSVSPKQSIRLSAGRGYRTPTLVESDAMEMYTLNGLPVRIGVASPYDVAPEKVNFAELGYVGVIDQANLKFDGRVYVERYSAYLNAYSCGLNGNQDPCTFALPAGYVAIPGYGYSAYVYTNAGSIHVTGGELALDWHHATVGRLLLSYAVTNVHSNGIPEFKTGQDIDSSAPVQSLSLLWSKPLLWRMTASAGYYHVDYMKWLSDGDDQPAYDRLDLRLAKSFGKPGSQDEIAVTAQAVTGRHAEFRYSSWPRRQAFVTLKLGF